MEPATDLSILKDWEAFKPSAKGYVEARSALGLGVKEIKKLLENVYSVQGDGSITGQFLFEDSPDPGMVFGGEPLRMPLTETDHHGLRQNATKEGGIFTLNLEEIRLQNPRWESTVMKGAVAALTNMTVEPTSARFDLKLTSVNSVDSLCTQALDLSPQTENHFATLLVILPTRINLVSTLKFRHGGLVENHDIQSGPFSMVFLTVYTGIEEVVLSTADGLICYFQYNLTSANPSRPSLRHLVGPVQEIADAFSAWSFLLNNENKAKAVTTDVGLNHIFYQLNEAYTSSDTASDLGDPKDEAVLLHLSPPAKYYGFNILLAHVQIHISREWTESHDYKDYDAWENYKAKDFTLLEGNNDVEIETEWEVTDLWGRKMNCDDMEAIQELDEEIERRRVLSPFNCQINLYDDEDMEPELDVDDIGIYQDHVRLSGTKEASFLMIVPAKQPKNRA